MSAPNAADRRQVEHAGRKEKDRERRQDDDLRVVLSLPEGRRFIWRIMGWSGYLENPTHARGDMTHQNIGRGDCGRMLLSEIVRVDERAYLLMQQEAWKQAKSDAVEAEAVRTKAATERA